MDFRRTGYLVAGAEGKDLDVEDNKVVNKYENWTCSGTLFTETRNYDV